MREILSSLIQDFDLEKLYRFFRAKSNTLRFPREKLSLLEKEEEHFGEGTLLSQGELEDETLICSAFPVKKALSERSGKKKQYELGKRILKEHYTDAGIFIFYDRQGNFRFSLITASYRGPKRDFSHFKRTTYFVSPEYTNKTFLKQIGDADFTSLEKLKEAFSVEKVTKEFFLAYHRLYEDLRAELSNNKTFLQQKEKYHIDTRNFPKKLLGQIVFLYFLQKKGWLGVPENGKWGEGDSNFLRTLYRTCQKEKKNFYNDFLEPLFYGTLNNSRRDTPDPSYSKTFSCRIPFLNGGLFESPYDWEGSFIYLKDEIFRNILNVFDRFHFTVEEESPDDKEVAVDPEMLGKVFENLLEENLRKGKGTYYTPREIVYYMCEQSLIAYLTTHTKLSEETIRTLIQPQEETEQSALSENTILKLDELLRTIRVCDPACGSGAFLVGMLNKIVHLRLLLRTLSRELSPKTEYELKKEAIQNSLYGVDIDPGAIEIAKLRLWLSLVVDYELKEIEPLPNLDYRLICGNSLIEEFEGVTFYPKEEKQGELLHDNEREEIEKELQKKIKAYFNLHDDEEKKRAREKINGLKDRLIRKALEKRKQELAEKIKTEKNKADMLNKKSRETYLKQWETIFQSEANIQKTLRYLHDPRQEKPFFLWKLEFMDVFQEKGGFDVVIANPPYLSHDKIEEKKNLAEKFKAYNPFADLYCYFLETALNLENEMGLLCFITSNSYLKAEYGRPLRNLLLEKDYILYIINIEDFQMFDAAIVNISVLIAQSYYKTEHPKCLIVNAGYDGKIPFEVFIEKNKFFYSQDDFREKSWYLLHPQQLSIKNKIELAWKSLEMYGTKIRLGIATGANKVFVIDEAQKNELIKKDCRNARIIKPVLRGRDIFRYKYQFNNKYIILTANGIDVQKEYPEIYSYLDSFGDSFKKRGAQGEHWSNLRPTAFLDDFKKEKIVWIELTDKGRFALCSEEIYLLNSAYFLIPPKQFSAKYLLALLNSKLIEFYLGLIAETSGMGVTRWINNYVKDFPIPEISVSTQKPFIDVVNKILAITSRPDYDPKSNTDLNKQVHTYEKQIDQLVYKLYNLTDEEIKIVEGIG